MIAAVGSAIIIVLNFKMVMIAIVKRVIAVIVMSTIDFVILENNFIIIEDIVTRQQNPCFQRSWAMFAESFEGNTLAIYQMYLYKSYELVLLFHHLFK